MYLKSLLLHNFRNYSSENISFSPRLNVIYGGNAQGKTNLLEAIYLISTGKSFRTPNLKDLIQKDKNYFYLEALFKRDGVSQTLKLYFDGTNKKIIYNSSNLPSFSSLLGIIPTILNSPYDHELILGKPTVRRKLLNLHIAQKDPLYIHHLSRFLKALKQRNYLLKNKDESTIDLFENEMAKSASYIISRRLAMIVSLKSYLIKTAKKLSIKNEEIDLKYNSSLKISTENDLYTSYLTELKKRRKKELFLGYTITGPHRDDLEIYINGNIASTFASEGQKNTFVSSLRFAEWHILSEDLNINPLMAIDDFAAHLDSSRQDLLKSYLNNFSQVFITTPCFEKWEKASSFKVEEGNIQV